MPPCRRGMDQLIQIAFKIIVSPQMQGAEIIQVLQVAGTKFFQGVCLQKLILQIFRQMGRRIFRDSIRFRHRRKCLKKFFCLPVAPVCPQKPCIDHVLPVAVVNAVVGA